MGIPTKKRKKFDKQVAEFKSANKRMEQRRKWRIMIGLCIVLGSLFLDFFSAVLQRNYSPGFGSDQLVFAVFGALILLDGIK